MGLFSKLFNNKKISEVSELIDIPMNRDGIRGPQISHNEDDYALTIFLWAHNKALPIRKNDDYPRYLLFECGIKNPVAYHQELISRGYFEPAPISSMLSSLKVSELKEILQKLDQPTTGKKDALINRILENSDELFLENLYHDKLYILSEKGADVLKRHNDYVLVHKHKNWQIDIEDYRANWRPGYSYYDVAWGILNKRAVKDKQNFGRNEYYYMFQLLEETEEHERAAEMLLQVLYIDLSGVCGMNSYQMYRSGYLTKKELLEDFSIAIMLAPGIISAISNFKDIDIDAVVDRIYDKKLPIQLCDKTLFLQILRSIFNDTYDKELFEKQLKREYNKMVKSM